MKSSFKETILIFKSPKLMPGSDLAVSVTTTSLVPGSLASSRYACCL